MVSRKHRDLEKRLDPIQTNFSGPSSSQQSPRPDLCGSHTSTEALVFGVDSFIPLSSDSETESPNESNVRLTLGSNIATGVDSKTGYGWGVGKVEEGSPVKHDRLTGLIPRSLLYNSHSYTPNRPNTTNSPNSTLKSNTSPITTTNLHGGISPFAPNGSDSRTSPLGSALGRKLTGPEGVRERVDTGGRLDELRRLLAKDDLSYYVVPSEDPHQSEYVPASHKRVEWISGFTGSSGQVIVTKLEAYLVIDFRYWLQARKELDKDWHLICAGTVDGPKDWVEWLVGRVNDHSRIGVDARMLSHEKASILKTQLALKSSRLVHPSQNFIDLIWKDKPRNSREPIFIQPVEFTGKEAAMKLSELRLWIREQPPASPLHTEATPTQTHVATLITSLPSIAYLLNLRGDDIPFTSFFQAYFFVSLDRAVLFIDWAKVSDVSDYLDQLGVERKEYNDLWPFLKQGEWGEGKVLISPQAPYAISLMLSHLRYTVAPSIVDEIRAVKNDAEIDGLRRAHLRDGASFTRWFACLEDKLSSESNTTEYHAAFGLTQYRKHNTHYWRLSHEDISASGPNAALPHYSATQSGARVIDRDTPYLIDSGGQYRDGTCNTARTAHFGRATAEQSEAYTKLLQDHIAIDSATFSKGTTSKDLLNHTHGAIRGSLKVQDNPHSSCNSITLVPGHVVANEHSFSLEGKWGMRIESALAVRVNEKETAGDKFLRLERLTCVPIQTRMVKENMLSKDEKQWLKEHNQWCREQLEPFLAGDKRALKWLRHESERAAAISSSGSFSPIHRLRLRT